MENVYRQREALSFKFERHAVMLGLRLSVLPEEWSLPTPSTVFHSFKGEGGIVGWRSKGGGGGGGEYIILLGYLSRWDSKDSRWGKCPDQYRI